MAITIDPLTGVTFNDGSVQTSAASAFGSGTWQSFTSPTRVAGTMYTNSTGKPIVVSIARNGANYTNTVIYVNGNVAASAGVDQYGGSELMTAFVPNGATYQVSTTPGGWWELR